MGAAWLLQSPEPIVRYRARTWLLGAAEDDPEARADRALAPDGPSVRALLDIPDSSVSPYRKWSGLHWRLVSLADLALPADRGDVRALLNEAVDRELDWIASPRHLDSVPRIDGLYRADASIEGNAVYAASRFGHAGDERTVRLVQRLLEWQWPDGGWNCDRASSGYRSSFHESWATAIGLATFGHATGTPDALAAARRTTELLLEHRLVQRLDGERTIHPSFTVPHWPAYWHYDLLAGLRTLHAVDASLLRDPRAVPALDRLQARQAPDGRIPAARPWWRSGRNATSLVDVVDWGAGRGDEVLTLWALVVLAAAGRDEGGRGPEISART